MLPTPPKPDYMHLHSKQRPSHEPRSSIKHTVLGEPHNSCHCRSLNSQRSFCYMTFSCVWNASVYRADRERVHSRTRLPPSSPPGSGRRSVQKSVTRTSHPFLIFIPSDRPGLCLFSAVFTALESVYVTQM